MKLLLRLVNWLNPWNTSRRLLRWHRATQRFLLPSVAAYQEALSEAQQIQLNLRTHAKNYAKLRPQCFDCGRKKDAREETIRECERISDTIRRIRSEFPGIDIESETGVFQIAMVLFPSKLLRLAPMAVDRYDPTITRLLQDIELGREGRD